MPVSRNTKHTLRHDLSRRNQARHLRKLAERDAREHKNGKKIRAAIWDCQHGGVDWSVVQRLIWELYPGLKPQTRPRHSERIRTKEQNQYKAKRRAGIPGY